MFWVREIAGWGLVVFSLYLVRVGLIFLMDTSSPQIVQAAIVMMAGMGVLRAGILLIRISTAAGIWRNEAPRS